MAAKTQTVLGFDFGMKRIGVAVGQTVTATASPLMTLQAINGEPRWEEVSKLVQEWRPDAFVVGIPLNMDGTEQHLTAAARQFAHTLAKRFTLPAHEMDERLSTKEVRSRLFAAGGYRALQKAAIDSFAAQLIVENWLRLQKGDK
ncbi:MAG: Holliday junction resolvase RuvX [Coxiellaceae bacterium]|nr:MAG: Holliday junction resolvase RuvX [Coxiellaceae bacterium]